ncbi:MAG: efflux RND transporter permease subunit, partial [Geobacteraceae bacterium]
MKDQRYIKDEVESGNRRLMGLSIAAAVMLFLLVTRLWYLQIIESDNLLDLSESNRLRFVPVAASRGTILDRNGKILVGNTPSFSLAVIPQDVKDKNTLIAHLSKSLDLDRTELLGKWEKGKGRARYYPIILASGITRDQLEFLEENRLQLAGIDIEMKPVREYPNGNLAAHLLGHLGEISENELDRPELQIEPKRQLAADLGVSTEALSETIRVATLGDIDANLAKFNAGDRLVPIRVELDESARGDIGRLEDLRVATASGGAVPLSVVADFSIGHGPTAINRYDRTRRVTIEGDLKGEAALGDAVNAIRALPTAKKLPPGVEIRETGDVEVMSEVFQSFAEAIGAGVMMVYALLVLLFGSFLQPITILVSLPLSIGGAIGALL